MIYYKPKKKCFKLNLIILLFAVLIVIPTILTSIQGIIVFVNDEEGTSEILTKQIPNQSSVYYENTTGYAWGVYVSGDYAYVADWYSGLAIIDISDPTNPSEPIYIDTTGRACSVYVSGDYAYVADGDSGLAIIDISDPINPVLLVYEVIGCAKGVYISGDYAYIATHNSGLSIVDISDPTNPGLKIKKDTTGYATDVYVSGDYAYIADYYSGLAIIDISDPTNPGDPIYRDTTGHATGIYISGDNAYIADGSSGLAVIDISDPTNPGMPVYEDTNAPAYDVYVSGDYVYIANHHSGLAVIDISDPTDPEPPVFEDTTDYAYGLFVDGNYAFVADGSSGLAVIDISKQINPGIPVYRATTGWAWGVYVSGDYAYIGDEESGLAVIDISDPTNPGTPVYEDTTGDALGVFISGDYAFVADGFYGLAVINISDPTNPGSPVYGATTGIARGVFISGDYAYLADGNSGLAVIDISDPINPGDSIYRDTAGYAIGVYVSGDYAYVADGDSGLAVIDISDPINPGDPVYEDTTGHAYDVYVNGDYAFVADGSSGLAVIDISDPTNPGPPVYEDTTGLANGLHVDGNYAYIADYFSGLAVIDISNPTNPGTPVYESTNDWACKIYVCGDYAYIGDANSGLAVIQVRERIDMVDPIMTSVPSNFFVESGYTGVSISWTAMDTNPDTYTIELQGTGIVTGPIAWSSGAEISYDVPDGLSVGEYFYTINFTDDDDNFITDTVKMTVQDTKVPLITSAPSDIFVESGYTGVSLSWTATDENPNTYEIELQGTGVVAGPIAWFNGIEITYNIPDGLSVGEYFYTVNFTDDSNNFITDTVKLTVQDTEVPIITSAPSDIFVESDYTGVSISWTATDENPNTYEIELQGTGVVAGPITWFSGIEITYDVPDGLSIGEYFYIVNFTDNYNNLMTDTVKLTVQDTEVPIITSAPSDIFVESGYTGVSISWTATDPNPNTYEIELQGTGVVVGPIAWSSGVEITYDVPDGLSVGEYFYIVNFTDDYNNFMTDTVKFTVQYKDPIITSAPSDFEIESGYTGVSISWTATDLNPNTYEIELQGSGVVAGPTSWFSGVAIIYNVPDGLGLGEYFYTINFTDDDDNFITDTVKFTVQYKDNPIITSAPSDFEIESDYTGVGISWTATDSNPNTYEIEFEGSGIVAGPTEWSSGVAITYNVPDGLTAGDYFYTITFTDDAGNFVIDTIKITVKEEPPVADDPQIPFGNWYLIFLGISITALVLIQKRRK